MATKTKKPSSTVEFEEEQAIQNPEEYISFKATHFYSVLVVLAFAVGVLVGYVAWGRETASVAAVPETTAQQPSNNNPAGVISSPTPRAYVRYDVPTEGFPSIGPEDAEIVVVEFSDFQCPFCRKFHQETYQALLDAYPGQIRFVYRNLPLTQIHPDAMGAAVASLCANDQDAYWDYHDKLFTGELLGEAVYVQYATDLGLDVEEFTACLSSGKHDQFIQDDMGFSLGLGVQSTPTFFINGLALVGAQPLSSFQQLIDLELAGEISQN
jgi:protein-disulfide isomerase